MSVKTMENDSLDFIRGLTEPDPERIRKAPKADLHNHALLGCRIRMAEEFYAAPIAPFRYAGGGIQAMNRWIRENYFPVITRPGGFRAMVEAAFRTAKEDGVTLLEMSFDAGIGPMLGIPPGEVVEIVKEAHRTCAPEIEFRPDLGFNRSMPVKKHLVFFEAYLDLDFFRGIDLYDDELCQPVQNFREIYRFARKNGFRCKAHAGEFGSAESVRETVEVLGLDDVQHGIAAARSEEVMKWLAERGTRLNICPSSNVILQRAPSMKEHPIRVLYDHGVRVTVNSDDILVFGQGVGDEFLNLFRAGVFSAEELDEIRQNALS